MLSVRETVKHVPQLDNNFAGLFSSASAGPIFLPGQKADAPEQLEDDFEFLEIDLSPLTF